MLLKIQDFLVTTPSRLICDYLHFRGPCCLHWFVIIYISEDLAASTISRYIPEGLGYDDWGYVYIYVTSLWLWLSEYLYLTVRYRQLRIWTVEVCDSICTNKNQPKFMQFGVSVLWYFNWSHEAISNSCCQNKNAFYFKDIVRKGGLFRLGGLCRSKRWSAEVGNANRLWFE